MITSRLPPRMTRRTYTNKRGEIWVGYYYRLPVDENGKQKVIPLGLDLIEAKRRWAELEGQPRPRDVRLLGFIFDRYEREVTPQKAPRTQFDDRQRLKPLRAVLADLSIDALTPQVIRKYLDGRSAKVRANREIALLSAIFNRAREWGYTDRPNPVQGVKRNKEMGRRIYVSDETLALVYRHCPPVIQDALDLAYLTGQRPADVLRLRWDQIREGAIWFEQGKTKTKLRIEVVGELAEVIARCRARPITGVTVLADPNGRSLKPFGYFRSQFARARDLAEQEARALGMAFERFQFRDLRAKATSDLESMAQARKLLGHATESMTRAYVRERIGERVRPPARKASTT